MENINMKTRVYSFIIIIYIVVIGRFFRDQIFRETIGLPAVIYFSILFILSGLFIKNYIPKKKKRLTIYLAAYTIIANAIIVFYFIR